MSYHPVFSFQACTLDFSSLKYLTLPSLCVSVKALDWLICLSLSRLRQIYYISLLREDRFTGKIVLNISLSIPVLINIYNIVSLPFHIFFKKTYSPRPISHIYKNRTFFNTLWNTFGVQQILLNTEMTIRYVSEFRVDWNAYYLDFSTGKLRKQHLARILQAFPSRRQIIFDIVDLIPLATLWLTDP